MSYNSQIRYRSMLRRLAAAVATVQFVVLTFIAMSPPAMATAIGPGPSQPNILFDGPGPRTNVTWNSGVSLGAGTYNVSDFLVNTDAANGIVVPFLATYSNSPNNPTFTTIWVGPDLVGDNAAGIHTVNFTAGTQQFTLAGPTSLYSGVWHDGVSKVALTLDIGTKTAHDPNFGHPGPAGSVIGGGAAFQYPDVTNVSPRTYAYRIDVAPLIPPPPVTGTPIADLFSTGVNNSGTPLSDDTIPDPHWQLTAGPVGTNLGDMRVRTAAGGFPIGPWLADDAKSAWIGELSPNHDLTSAAGDFTATTTFTLPADVASVRLIGRWSTDNDAVALVLNGQQVDGPNSNQFAAWTEFDITSSNVVPGLNLFEASWNNAGGPGGVRVEFDEVRFQTVPEPSSLALASLAGIGLFGLLRKRTG